MIAAASSARLTGLVAGVETVAEFPEGGAVESVDAPGVVEGAIVPTGADIAGCPLPGVRLVVQASAASAIPSRASRRHLSRA